MFTGIETIYLDDILPLYTITIFYAYIGDIYSKEE